MAETLSLAVFDAYDNPRSALPYIGPAMKSGLSVIVIYSDISRCKAYIQHLPIPCLVQEIVSTRLLSTALLIVRQ